MQGGMAGADERSSLAGSAAVTSIERKRAFLLCLTFYCWMIAAAGRFLFVSDFMRPSAGRS